MSLSKVCLQNIRMWKIFQKYYDKIDKVLIVLQSQRNIVYDDQVPYTNSQSCFFTFDKYSG